MAAITMQRYIIILRIITIIKIKTTIFENIELYRIGMEHFY